MLSNMPIEYATEGLMHLCTPHVQPLYEVSSKLNRIILFYIGEDSIFSNVGLYESSREISHIFTKYYLLSRRILK